MRIYHIKRRKIAFFIAATLIVIGICALLAGCLPNNTEDAGVIRLSENDDRIAFLESLGWTVDVTPIEALDLELPDPLNEAWESYAQLQAAQGLPFSDYAGATVQRYTYIVTNYPAIEQGVQANLYLCDDVLIGGDIIFTGQGGFQKDLNFPTTDQQ